MVGITLVQLLKDFVNIEHGDWDMTMHRLILHCAALGSALFVAIIWRITHPQSEAGHHPPA